MNENELALCGKIFALIRDNNKIKKDEIIKETNESKYMIDKVINALKEQGILERIGGRNKGCWKIIEKLEDKKFDRVAIQRIIINKENKENKETSMTEMLIIDYQKNLRNLRNKLTRNKFVFKDWYDNRRILLYYTDFELYEASLGLYQEELYLENVDLQKYPKSFKIFRIASEVFWQLRDNRLKTKDGSNEWNVVVKIITWEFIHQYLAEYRTYKKIIESLLSNDNEVDKDDLVVKIIVRFLSEEGDFYLYATEGLEQYRGEKYLPLIKDYVEIELEKKVIKLAKILLAAYYAITMFIIEDIIEECEK